jgi:hypothetical protein
VSGAAGGAAFISLVLLAIFAIAAPHALAVHAGDTLPAGSRGESSVCAFMPCGRRRIRPERDRQYGADASG